MPSKRQTVRAGSFIVTEEPGAISRDAAWLAEGQNLVAGTLLAEGEGDDLIAWESGDCAGILFAGADARSSRQRVTIVSRLATVNLELLTFGEAEESDVRDALLSRRIVVLADHSIEGNGGGGSSPYVAQAFHLDGSSSVTLANSVIPDSPLVAYSIFMKLHDYLALGQGLNFSIIVDATNYNFNVDIQTSGDGLTVGPAFKFTTDPNDYKPVAVDNTVIAYSEDGTVWVWYAGSLDTGHANGQKRAVVVADGVVIGNVVDDANGSDAFNMNFNGITLAIPDFNDGPAMRGDFAEVWFAPGQYVDFSDPDVQAKFRDPVTGKPVSLGADGSLPTGTAPAIYLNDATGTNKGGGGSTTVAEGALTAASTSPSD